MTAEYEQIQLGPDDVLVLVSQRSLSAEEADRLTAQIPARLLGRVVVVDGTSYSAQVVRRGEHA